MRVATAALLCVLLLYALPAASQPSVSPDLTEGIRELVVINRTNRQFMRIGTAFHTGDGVFYTNAHVAKAKLPDGYTEFYLAGLATLSISSWTGPATVACVHKAWRPQQAEDGRAFPYDVATLKVEKSEGISALRFSATRPQLGQLVRMAGFAAASRAWPPVLYVSSGRITSIDYVQQSTTIDVDAGFALEGSSGSPVLDAQDGVVGIVFGRQGERGSGTAARVFAVYTDAIKTVCD